MDRGLSPKRAINLPPAFLTPSIQEYHIRNCLTFKKHTNLWIVRSIAFEIQQNILYEWCSKLKLKTNMLYNFLVCNLLTGAEDSVRPAGFAQIFLRRTHVILT
ncbi:hypothetical protein [Leptospira interrogans]|uniref:hypothetical protein n=1 Tax=Leptospira interrogans TaxID=173 RepID=UPI000A306000|nr:hypothetical protein [Leptospira interrogans]